uniref:Leucine zipper transcription factor-like protein 1 n=1 Tax=Oncorhynchus mykiss TaxID=8022 RepID=A0A8C7PSG6_ONCMY
MPEFGFNEHHQNDAINYMRFACSKRAIRLKTIDPCFEDLKDNRLVDETFTVDEVLDGLKLVVRGEVETELVNTAHTNVLLLRQLFSQAEKFYLRLQTDISELENRELLEQVAEFEKTEFKNQNKEISRLQEENDKLKGRLQTMETLEVACSIPIVFQAMGALVFSSKAERALKNLQKVQGEQKMATRSQEITSLEDTVAALPPRETCRTTWSLPNTTCSGYKNSWP